MSSAPFPDDQGPTVVRLTEPGELVASLPYLLGFHPTDSLVVVAFNPDTDELKMVGRTDLPDLVAVPELTAGLVKPLLGHGTVAMVLIVITEDHGPGLPHRALIGECIATFRSAGVDVLDVVWAAATATGAEWRRYVGPDHGVIPDSTTNTLAAYAVLSGRVIHASRHTMAEALAPDPDNLLDRRARVLAAVAAEHQPHHSDPYRQYSLLDQSIRAAHEGHLPATDEQAMRLVLALRDHIVRDACFQHTDGPCSDGAERLWRYLVRATPGPDRAEPAVLLAITAYLRADTVVAAMALDCARTANPRHRFAELLTEAVEIGMPPTVLRRVINKAAVAGLDKVMATSPGARNQPDV